MLVAGVSTEKVGEVAQTLIGVAPRSSTVSRLNQTLTEHFETWRQRSLHPHSRILYLDGVHFTVRHGDRTASTIIVTALGVDVEGNNEVLASGGVLKKGTMGGWRCFKTSALVGLLRWICL